MPPPGIARTCSTTSLTVAPLGSVISMLSRCKTSAYEAKRSAVTVILVTYRRTTGGQEVKADKAGQRLKADKTDKAGQIRIKQKNWGSSGFRVGDLEVGRRTEL